MADVKSLLKEARKLIDNKDFKEAQECCKNILRKDKQNYLGLILLGKSLQDSDQAALAFQKAIASKPDHPLAWQGLANYYELKEEIVAKVKLIAIYDEILKLQIEEEKALEILTKLGQLGCSLKENQVITVLIKYMDKNLDEKVYSAAGKQLIELLKTDITCKDGDILKVINYLSQVIDKEANDALNILLGKVILQKNSFIDAMKEVMNLIFFTPSVTFREWLCKYLCAYYIQNNSFSGFDIDTHINNVIVGIENSKYPGMLQSMILYDKGLYLEAYKQCVPLVNYQEADVTEATFIIRCTFKLKKFSVAQKLATNFLIKVKDKDFAIILKKFLFLSLAEQQKWKQAVLIANEIPAASMDINEQATLAKCYIENNEHADHVMKNLRETEHYGQLEALSLIKQGKYEDAIKLLDESPDKPLNLFYLGQVYWKLGEFDKCLIYLLKAAKVNTDHADTFFYLGIIYQHYKQDLEKAKKCYEKAFSLNNIDIDIIKNLSIIYTKLGLSDVDFDLLCKASQNVQIDLQWINFRLGLHYINKRDWEEAILPFRNVIKADPNNAIAFECLADAYYSRGSFTSALKAYNKVISMNPRNIVHCLTRIGYINSLLTQYEDAIATFEKVFEMEPNSLLALKGITETWMRIAKKKLNAKLFGSARDTAQYAINYLIQALTKEKKFLCFWKLLADALIFVTKLPNEYCYVFMKNSFTNADTNLMPRMEKHDIYAQALACYSRTAKQKLQFTSYDLASTYLDYYHATNEMVNCHISFKLTIANIKIQPSSWRNWNLLGKICIFMKRYALAQHCFIKALLVTRKWSVAKIWCNLGTLYVKLGLHKLANYCFWRGQSTLPSYPQSWIGQGLIAEVIRKEEAMDLFRHACRLGYHPESAMGYADWVCRILKDDTYKSSSELKYVIDGLYAISYAMDLVLWFIRFEPNDAYANNILGILQERNNLLDSALISYQKAFQYANENKKNIILLNISRTLLRLGKYDEAIKSYKEISEASLNSACGLALAFFKKGLYEESYSTYETALQWLCNNDDEKSDLLVAMSGIVYMFKGMDDAKTLLFHSIQVSLKKPTPYSLFAICSLGIIHSDQGLSKLALSELQKYEKDSNFGYDIGFLKSYLALNDDVNKAIKLLSDSLHDHPSSTELWSCMAQYCLKASDTKAKIASSCAQRALSSAHDKNDTDSANMLATASIAEHIAGHKLKSLLLAKAGLHMYPCQSEIWAALLFSVLTNKMWFEKKKWILRVTGYMRKYLDTTRGLNRWINLLEKKLSRY
ncbi:tetratricopeptide repeat protein 37 [Maniola hyperantus]|uniref:tetratricopeptide repeat protein 37 n=1 Tax=Aphantopus hyperantus TaxID=2795564 RepID=UPI001569C220|nr:tetratricopeptide repeat protein 37 [Maniola hyperantus]